MVIIYFLVVELEVLEGVIIDRVGGYRIRIVFFGKYFEGIGGFVYGCWI